MSQSFVQLATDGSGKKIDTQVTTTAAQHRQVVSIGDPSTDASVAPVDATKGLRVDLTNTGANATAIKVDGSAVTQPVSGTVSITANSAVNVAQINGVTTLMGNGITGTGSQRVTIASDNTAFSVNAVQSGSWTVSPAAATPVLANALSTSVVTVIGSAAKLDSYYVYNPNASVAYVQIFDISGAVTLGTSVPKWSIAIPATSGANLSNVNLNFANAIKVAATTTATGLTAPSTALDANFGYR